jgi:hypothetical protein
MNQIIIAKKVSHNGVEFLDFAMDDNDDLLSFETYGDASKFLKAEVGDTEEILSYIITTIEAQQNNPRLQAAMNYKNQQTQSNVTSVDSGAASAANPDAVKDTINITFTVLASDYEVLNNDSILNKLTNKQLVPVVAFVDPTNPQQPVPVANLLLDKVFIEKVD